MTQNRSQPRRNLATEILAQLRTEIITGVLKQGEALGETMLAKRFGVSRAPVREAMIELERAGLIQFGKTGRTHVKTLEDEDIVEIVETRVALESMGARLAATNWSEADTRWVENNITEQMKAVTGAEFSRLDIAMHEYIMKRSGNKRLAMSWQNIRWQFEMALTYIHHLQEKMAHDLRRFTVTAHWKVLDELAARQPEAAAKMMSHHITGSLEWSIPGILELRATGANDSSGTGAKTPSVETSH